MAQTKEAQRRGRKRQRLDLDTNDLLDLRRSVATQLGVRVHARSHLDPFDIGDTLIREDNLVRLLAQIQGKLPSGL